jgi:hypothetical protein
VSTKPSIILPRIRITLEIFVNDDNIIVDIIESTELLESTVIVEVESLVHSNP